MQRPDLPRVCDFDKPTIYPVPLPRPPSILRSNEQLWHAVAEALDVQAHLEPAVAMRNAVVIHTVLVDHLRESLHSNPGNT